MTNLAQETKKPSRISSYDLDGCAVVVWKDGLPLKISRKHFEDWVGKTGKLAYVQIYEAGGEIYEQYKQACIDEYWEFCPQEQILTDLQDYLTEKMF